MKANYLAKPFAGLAAMAICLAASAQPKGLPIGSDVATPTRTDGAAALSPFIAPAALPVAVKPAKKAAVKAFAEQAPFSRKFLSESNLADFTIVDGNSDKVTFAFNSSNRCLEVLAPASGAQEDYLVLPSLSLKKYLTYQISVSVATLTSKGAKMQLVAAKGKDLASLRAAATIGETMDVATLLPDWEDAQFTFTPDEDADYFLAVKCITPSTGTRFYLRGIDVKAGVNMITPKAPVNAVASAPEDGSFKVTITWEPPTEYANGGGSIAEPLLFDVVRAVDGRYIATDLPAEYPTNTFVDNAPEKGENVYYVISKTPRVYGQYATVGAFVGFDIPQDVDFINAEYGGDNGKAALSWAEVTNDVRGLCYPSQMLYDLYQLSPGSQLLLGQYPGTELKVQACYPTAEQTFFTFCVRAHSTEGQSENITYATPLALGTPHSLPYFESWADCMTRKSISLDIDNGWGQWVACSDLYFQDLKSVDGDNGFTMYEAEYTGPSRLLLGLFTIPADAADPTVAMYVRSLQHSANLVSVLVDAHDGNGYQSIADFSTDYDEGDTQSQWKLKTASLAEFKGKTVHVAIQARAVNAIMTAFDKFHMFDATDFNISNVRLFAPENFRAGEKATFTVSVDNYGHNPLAAADFKVELYKGSQLVATVPGTDVKPYATCSVSLEYTPNLGDSKATFHAVAVCEKDPSESDNISGYVTLQADAFDYPAVSALTAARNSDNEVELRWEAPDLSVMPMASVTEDFEDTDPFKIVTEMGTFTLVDEDDSPTRCHQLGIPNLPDYSHLSWVCIDVDSMGLTQPARSGKRMIASVCNSGIVYNSDWIITPRLSGEAQTITFWAKSYNFNYGEQMSVYLSTSDSELSSFELIDEVTVPYSWTRYKLALNEGVNYVAFVNSGFNRYMLMLDDITYSPADGERIDLSLAGYNIYRGGTLLNPELVTDLSFTDTDAPVIPATYMVTAVYDKGESSGASARSASAGVQSPAADSEIEVAVTGSTLSVTAKGLIKVFAADGSLMAHGNDSLSKSMAPGVYIVTAQGQARKVAVK